MKKGTFCFSIDLELLWGRITSPNFFYFIERSKKERVIIDRILNLSEKYEISITWAAVGHLFLDKCFPQKGILHPKIKKVQYQNIDWFEKDPATSLKKDPLWYGKDIIQKIKKYKSHEIASHSFSHIRFGDLSCKKENAESEIKECLEVAKKTNIILKSFVFPYNSISYLEVLKKFGFTSYRGFSSNKIHRLKFFKKIYMLFQLFGIFPCEVSKPFFVNGLLNIPSSMYFVSSRGFRKFIPRKIRFYQAKKGINRAIKEAKVFHLWTHTIDFTDNTEILLKDLESIFKYANEKKNKGILEVKTMQEIAENKIK